MPKALFTSIERRELLNAIAFANARLLKSSVAEDQLELGNCCLTCRYWREGGDFVSKQILGCNNAIRVGRLQCDQKEIALKRVEDTQTVIGIVGPNDEVAELARSLAEQFAAVIVTEDAAVVLG